MSQTNFWWTEILFMCQMCVWRGYGWFWAILWSKWCSMGECSWLWVRNQNFKDPWRVSTPPQKTLNDLVFAKKYILDQKKLSLATLKRFFENLKKKLKKKVFSSTYATFGQNISFFAKKRQATKQATEFSNDVKQIYDFSKCFKGSVVHIGRFLSKTKGFWGNFWWNLKKKW